MAILIVEEPTVAVCLNAYLQLLKVPGSVFDKIYAKVVSLGFLSNSDDILVEVLQNLSEFTYICELPIGKPTRFKAKIKAALNSKIHSNIMDRFERSMGIVWTRDMLGSDDKEESDNSITQTDKVFMPLSLMLSEQPKKMMENIKKRLRVESSDPDRHAPPPIQNPDKSDPKEKLEEQVGPKEIILSKHGDQAISLINFDKAIF
ncbi:hypothetical protein, partial [Ewingella americana]|uniref:hypothetical protein n=1 Tax=Ewingella americana TaxID=41202 RepID=UPI00112A7957